MRAQLSAPTWLVSGRRPCPGGEQTLLASAWGNTEPEARAFYGRLQDLAERQRLPGGFSGARWEPDQLTFTRVEEVKP